MFTFAHYSTVLRVIIKQELYNSDVELETAVRQYDLLCDGGDEPLEDVHAVRYTFLARFAMNKNTKKLHSALRPDVFSQNYVMQKN